jgi:hypothetical protein
MDSNKETKSATPTLEDIMLMREQREAAEYEARQVAEREDKLLKAAKLNERLLRDQRTSDKEKKNHRSCNHLKGRGPQSGSQAPAPKFNLYAHQLPTGEFFIKCLAGCGMRWNQGDTREFLFNRDGVAKIPNYTGKSFEEMFALLPHDAVSRSDIPLTQPGSESVSA